jgi:ethanolamine kinase
VARRLAQWHAVMPVENVENTTIPQSPRMSAVDSFPQSRRKMSTSSLNVPNITPGMPSPNVWTVLQKWIIALPYDTKAQLDRRTVLQQQLDLLVEEIGNTGSVGKDGVSDLPNSTPSIANGDIACVFTL